MTMPRRSVLVLCSVSLGVLAACRTAPQARGDAPRDRTPEPVAATMSPAPVPMPPAVVTAPQNDRDRIRDIADSATRAPAWRNARWGILIVDAASGDTIVAHDIDKLFMPASNQKLLTGAIAVQQLGIDYRWKTPVLLRGTQRGATWDGDILVVGSGDPSFSDSLRAGSALSAFDGIARALTARGITRVTGRVLPHGDAFTGLTTGFGWEIDDLDESYGAPVDELMFNEGELLLRVRAGARAASKPSVTTAPTIAYPRILNDAVTTAPGEKGSPLRAAYDSVAGALVLTGSIAAGDSTNYSLSFRHPADAVTAAITQQLMAHDIQVAGRTLAAPTKSRASSDAAEPTLDTLVVLESPPLSEVLRRMQKPSQNQIAELLFRTSGLRASGVGSADSARAVGARTLAAWGVRTEDAAYRDGSGLSRHDYVTPHAIVRVLDAMRTSPAFDAYRNALPLAGVDGTLRNRMRGTPAAGNAQAKTGTVDKARSLSGYVTTADGRLVMFSMLCNNFTLPNREVERVQDMLVVALANARLGAPGTAGTR